MRNAALVQPDRAAGDLAGIARRAGAIACATCCWAARPEAPRTRRASRIADIINGLEPADADDVMKALEAARPQDAKAVRSMLFSFLDLPRLSQRARALLFDKLSTDLVVLALRGTDAEFREAALSAMAARSRRLVEGELASPTTGQARRDRQGAQGGGQDRAGDGAEGRTGAARQRSRTTAWRRRDASVESEWPTTATTTRPKTPTEKRLADAIERGNTPVSREIAFLTSLVAYLLIEIYVLPATTPALASAMLRISSTIPRAGGWRRGGDATLLIGAVAAIVARFVGPAAFLLMAFGVGGSILQNAPRIVAERIAPDFKRLSPFAGFVAAVRAARLDGVRQERAEARRRRRRSSALVVVSQRLALVDAMFVDVAGAAGPAAVAVPRAPPRRSRSRCWCSPAPISPGRASIGGATSA